MSQYKHVASQIKNDLCSRPLVDDGGHGDLQELLLQRDEGQQAAVEEAQQLQNPGQAEQDGDPGVLEECGVGG